MTNLLSKNKLMQKTIRLTGEIKVANPEMYKLLDETPLLISSVNNTKIRMLDFAKYFETLKEQMKYHDKPRFI